MECKALMQHLDKKNKKSIVMHFLLMLMTVVHKYIV